MTQETFTPQIPHRNNAGRGLFVLIFAFVILSVLTGLCANLLGKTSLEQARVMRLVALLQDVFLFTVPALAGVLVATNSPAEMLGVMKRPSWRAVSAMVLVMIFSIPALEGVIYWNYHLNLDFLGRALLEMARQLEDASSGAIMSMMGDASVGTLIVNILIIGVAAGFSEEIFFRGGLQRLFKAMGLNAHIAIWLVAIIFSGMHLQFYGFVPRLLLGAFFGYLLYWSNSLWLPVLAHILNNTVYVVTAWTQTRMNGEVPSTEPVLWNPLLIAASVIVTASLLFLLYGICVNRR